MSTLPAVELQPLDAEHQVVRNQVLDTSVLMPFLTASLFEAGPLRHVQQLLPKLVGAKLHPSCVFLHPVPASPLCRALSTSTALQHTRSYVFVQQSATLQSGFFSTLFLDRARQRTNLKKERAPNQSCSLWAVRKKWGSCFGSWGSLHVRTY